MVSDSGSFNEVVPVVVVPQRGRAQPCVLAALSANSSGSDLLPSWNDGKARQAIIDFVEKVTQPDSMYFVPPAEWIATFDNDGCLWTKQSMAPLSLDFRTAN